MIEVNSILLNDEFQCNGDNTTSFQFSWVPCCFFFFHILYGSVRSGIKKIGPRLKLQLGYGKYWNYVYFFPPCIEQMWMCSSLFFSTFWLKNAVKKVHIFENHWSESIIVHTNLPSVDQSVKWPAWNMKFENIPYVINTFYFLGRVGG